MYIYNNLLRNNYNTNSNVEIHEIEIWINDTYPRFETRYKITYYTHIAKKRQ